MGVGFFSTQRLSTRAIRSHILVFLLSTLKISGDMKGKRGSIRGIGY